jgi:hypothetical protein
MLVVEHAGIDRVAPVSDFAKDMAADADKLCEGYRKSENFGNGGGRGRKRK